jgi:hypothetical protein
LIGTYSFFCRLVSLAGSRPARGASMLTTRTQGGRR